MENRIYSAFTSGHGGNLCSVPGHGGSGKAVGLQVECHIECGTLEPDDCQ